MGAPLPTGALAGVWEAGCNRANMVQSKAFYFPKTMLFRTTLAPSIPIPAAAAMMMAG